MMTDNAGTGGVQGPPRLNIYQIRQLFVTFEYIDALLEDIEEVLDESASDRVFQRTIHDIPPDLHPVIEEAITRVRRRLIEIMEEQGVTVPPPSIPASRTIHSNLAVIHIALEEMRPKRQKKSGGDEREGPDTLFRSISGLQEMVTDLERSVGQGRAGSAGRSDVKNPGLQFCRDDHGL
ncbi:MAG TPA: hypothetical protein HA264_05570 [Methanolinea sp.]|nr:hypothetical protein [Methanolinea sp.]